MKISGSERRKIRISGRCLLGVGALLASGLLSAPLVAEPIDDSTRNAARELASQAADAFSAGDFERAFDLYHRAYALVPAPTLSLREARSLEKLGRLVEAVEACLRTTRMTLAPDAPAAYRQAVEEAYDTLNKLRPRVPKLKIVIRGAEAADASVTLDGRPVKSALLGVEQPVDPGAHEVVATTTGKRGTAQVTLAEGEKKVLELEVLDDPNAVPTPASAETQAMAAPSDRAADSEKPSGGLQRTLGWVGIGVGAAGLGVGVVTGLMATSKHSSAEEGCPDGKCPEGSQAADDMESFRSLRTISTVGYAVGLVGVAAGITLLLTAPSDTQTAHVSPFIGLGSAGITGRFQ